MLNVLKRSCQVASATLLLVMGTQATLHAEDQAPPTPLFKHTAVYVGPTHLAPPSVAPRATGLKIVPTFDSTITKDPNATAIMATINAAITELCSNYSDPVTVSVTFNKVNNGLGASLTSYTSASYTDFLTALKAHASTPNDATALARLPVQANNPVNSDPNMSLTLPNARTLGFSADPSSGQSDSTVSLNISLMNILPTDSDPNKYSLRETVLHELTEVLGSSSNLDSGTTGPICPIDLFRYDDKGNRSYTQSASALAFFVIDGTNMLTQFNQDKSGDFGDYYSVNGGQKPQIQDAFGTPGASNIPLGTELIVLDVVGYNRVGAGTIPTGGGGTGGTGGTTPPAIASAATCTPNPAFVGGMSLFSVSATDPNNSPITVAWDFGDGSKGSGTNTTHVYSALGTYNATATVMNGSGASATSSVVVNVSTAINKASSVRQSFMLNFKVPNDNGGSRGGKDRFDITLASDDFTNAADGTQVMVMIGSNVIDSGTLQRNKATGQYGGKFTLNIRSGTLRYVNTKAALQFQLSAFGAVNDDVDADVQVPISYMFNNAIYGDTFDFAYSATAGKSGKGR